MRQFSVALCFGLFFALLQTKAQTPTVGLLLNTEAAFNGYTLFNAGPGLSGALSGNSTAYLINNCGEMVNFWRSRYNAGLSCYLDYKGNLVRPIINRQTNTFGGPGGGGGVEMFDWEGNPIWLYDYNEPDLYFQHHDIEPLPNGNILIIAWEKFTPEQTANYGRAGTLVTEHIVEVKPVGISEAEIVWQWHAINHMVQDRLSDLNNFGTIADNPQLIDINLGNANDQLHFNSIDYIEEYDLILLSSRFLNEIYIIDHSTTTAEAASHEGGSYGKGGDILYRWGNPINYDLGTTADRKLNGQHGANWVPGSYNNGKPLIAIFNNNLSGTFNEGTSFVLVIEPPIRSDGTFRFIPGFPFEPTTPLISRAISGAPTGSSSTGLPNGNFLYCVNRGGEIGELDQAGELVWQYIIPTDQQGPVEQGQVGRSSSFNAEKYAPDFAGLADKDLSPKGVIERNPFENDCVIYQPKAPDAFFSFSIDESGQAVTFTDESLHQPTAWLWEFGDGNSSSEKNPLYDYEFAGDYAVCLTATNAYGEQTICETLTITIIDAIEGNEVSSFFIYPQPANDYVFIQNEYHQKVSYALINLMGKTVLAGETREKIALSDVKSGVYLLQFSFNSEKVAYLKLVVE